MAARASVASCFWVVLLAFLLMPALDASPRVVKCRQGSKACMAPDGDDEATAQTLLSRISRTTEAEVQPLAEVVEDEED
eukprot:CAMPEP_0172663530 /NCGR_PEP_ID=MMETSP1074-20121228/5991_1 /TAXON_ID=2916 /ORGANISM="Ceratium fusus, Strain PA161109" /LENGTH=78 /DNA_ID=CAMNT_0013479543 /DNA_START=69 /DNA_END=305 /DNA_ORIENTATION=-